MVWYVSHFEMRRANWGRCGSDIYLLLESCSYIIKVKTISVDVYAYSAVLLCANRKIRGSWNALARLLIIICTYCFRGSLSYFKYTHSSGDVSNFLCEYML